MKKLLKKLHTTVKAVMNDDGGAVTLEYGIVIMFGLGAAALAGGDLKQWVTDIYADAGTAVTTAQTAASQ